MTEEVIASAAPVTAELVCHYVQSPDRVRAPGELAYGRVEQALGAQTHLLVLCDHYGVIHRIPCTNERSRGLVSGLWHLSGTVKSPSLRPSLHLTRYIGYLVQGTLTLDLTPDPMVP